MTPNCQTIADWVLERYPDAEIQTTNCRKIAGTLTWSQHSWANGLDIFLPVKDLDALFPLLKAEFGPYIAHILWRVKDHFDHIHLDTWPQGYSKPPCAGGSLRVRHKDGRIGTQFTDDIPKPEPEDDMFVQLGDTGPYVEYWQRILRVLDPTFNIATDGFGVFGNETARVLAKFDPGPAVIGPGEAVNLQAQFAAKVGTPGSSVDAAANEVARRILNG